MRQSSWQLALQRFLADRVGVISLVIVSLWLLLAFLTLLGIVASKWSEQVAISHAPPTFFSQENNFPIGKTRDASEHDASGRERYVLTPTDIVDPIGNALSLITKRQHVRELASPTAVNIKDPIANGLQVARDTVAGQGFVSDLDLETTLPFGADKWGRDILGKTLKGAETSILVGIAAAFFAVGLGTMLGALSGWFGGWVDDLSNWIYNVFNSIPNILLILAIATVLGSKGSLAVVIILGVTGWTATYRLVRGEYMKHREREYVRAADVMGASSSRLMFVHILPNISHVILVQFSLLTVISIKAEVILSFLGFGVPVDGVSWGTMLTEAQNDLLLGIWWQLTAATVSMVIFVTALSLLTDSLRDALDPKLTH